MCGTVPEKVKAVVAGGYFLGARLVKQFPGLELVVCTPVTPALELSALMKMTSDGRRLPRFAAAAAVAPRRLLSPPFFGLFAYLFFISCLEVFVGIPLGSWRACFVVAFLLDIVSWQQRWC